MGQLFKRFYDRVYEARLSGVDIEVSYQIVILLEALSTYSDLTERIIQVKEEIEMGEGVSTIAQLEESITDYLRIKKSSKAPTHRQQEISAKQAVTGVCHGCGKKGHYLRDCPSRNKIMRLDNPKKNTGRPYREERE